MQVLSPNLPPSPPALTGSPPTHLGPYVEEESRLPPPPVERRRTEDDENLEVEQFNVMDAIPEYIKYIERTTDKAIFNYYDVRLPQSKFSFSNILKSEHSVESTDFPELIFRQYSFLSLEDSKRMKETGEMKVYNCSLCDPFTFKRSKRIGYLQENWDDMPTPIDYGLFMIEVNPIPRYKMDLLIVSRNHTSMMSLFYDSAYTTDLFNLISIINSIRPDHQFTVIGDMNSEKFHMNFHATTQITSIYSMMDSIEAQLGEALDRRKTAGGRDPIYSDPMKLELPGNINVLLLCSELSRDIDQYMRFHIDHLDAGYKFLSRECPLSIQLNYFTLHVKGVRFLCGALYLVKKKVTIHTISGITFKVSPVTGVIKPISGMGDVTSVSVEVLKSLDESVSKAKPICLSHDLLELSKMKQLANEIKIPPPKATAEYSANPHKYFSQYVKKREHNDYVEFMRALNEEQLRKLWIGFAVSGDIDAFTLLVSNYNQKLNISPHTFVFGIMLLISNKWKQAQLSTDCIEYAFYKVALTAIDLMYDPLKLSDDSVYPTFEHIYERENIYQSLRLGYNATYSFFKGWDYTSLVVRQFLNTVEFISSNRSKEYLNSHAIRGIFGIGRQIGDPSVSGIVKLVNYKFIPPPEGVLMKMMRNYGESVREAKNGDVINEFRKHLPHFMMTYGQFTCLTDRLDDVKKSYLDAAGKEVPYTDKVVSLDDFCPISAMQTHKNGGVTAKIGYNIIENVNPVLSMTSFIKIVPNPFALFSVISQTMLALDYAQKNYGFVHNDFHYGNILLYEIRRAEAEAVPRPNYTDRLGTKDIIFQYTTRKDQPAPISVKVYNHIPVIIDYGLTLVNGGHVWTNQERDGYLKAGLDLTHFDRAFDPFSFVVHTLVRLRVYNEPLLKEAAVIGFFEKFFELYWEVFIDMSPTRMVKEFMKLDLTKITAATKEEREDTLVNVLLSTIRESFMRKIIPRTEVWTTGKSVALNHGMLYDKTLMNGLLVNVTPLAIVGIIRDIVGQTLTNKNNTVLYKWGFVDKPGRQNTCGEDMDADDAADNDLRNKNYIDDMNRLYSEKKCPRYPESDGKIEECAFKLKNRIEEIRKRVFEDKKKRCDDLDMY